MQRMLRTTCFLFALLLAGTTARAQGMMPISVEGRGAYALPRGDWNEGDALGNGLGYGLDIRLQVLPLINIYGGWDSYSFKIEEMDDTDATDSGMHLGGQISMPLSPVTGISPFAFAGAIFNRTSMRIENNGVSLGVESDREIGYELGAGIAFPFAPGMAVTPQVRYRSHGVDFSLASGETHDADVSYLSLEIGVRLGL